MEGRVQEVNKTYPVLVLQEAELPAYIYLVGSRRKRRVYMAISDEKSGLYVKRCVAQKEK